jgi:PPOX class probable F420-dependent enzyme
MHVEVVMPPSGSPIPDEFWAILEKKAYAHIASIGPNGAPQSNPVWFEWDGERLLFSTIKSRAKYKNLTARPQVAASILDPDEPYLCLELRGVAEIDEDPDKGKAFINRMAHKYTGQDFGDRPGEERVIVAIRPDRTLTHS